MREAVATAMAKIDLRHCREALARALVHEGGHVNNRTGPPHLPWRYSYSERSTVPRICDAAWASKKLTGLSDVAQTQIP